LQVETLEVRTVPSTLDDSPVAAFQGVNDAVTVLTPVDPCRGVSVSYPTDPCREVTVVIPTESCRTVSPVFAGVLQGIDIGDNQIPPNPI
jgi:hypothetical protein